MQVQVKALEMAIEWAQSSKKVVKTRCTSWISKSGSKCLRFFKNNGSEIKKVGSNCKNLMNKCLQWVAVGIKIKRFNRNLAQTTSQRD